jgi:hypothetical protein
LQIMIAVEIAAKRVVHRLLMRGGVSKGTLKDYDRELQFGLVLNVHLVSLCPENLKPDETLLERINWGRKLRNKLMHDANFSANRQELRELHHTASKFLAFLVEVEDSTREQKL